MRVVFVKNHQLYQRIIPEERVRKNSSGQYILPRNHFSAGWMERVWGVNANDLPSLSFPTSEEIIRRAEHLRPRAG